MSGAIAIAGFAFLALIQSATKPPSPATDPSILFSIGFESGLAGWTKTNDRIFTIVDDPALARSGRACAMATATRGKDTGGEILWRLPKGQDQIYLRFYCRFAADTCWPHHFVKIRALAPGFDGKAGEAPPGDRGFWTGIEPLRGTWRLYTYWHQMRGWNNPGPDSRKNDDGTDNTGKNDFFGNSFTPDGQPPVPDPRPFPGFQFRTVPDLKINEIALLWYVSEEYAAKGTAERNRVYFDDVAVATRYLKPISK